MNTKKQEQEKTQDHHEEQVHVHGPNCNHGHNHAHIAPVIRTGTKVGRNDECPCGSKQKFKKCCGK